VSHEKRGKFPMPKDVNFAATSSANKNLHLESGQTNALPFSQDSILEMRALPKGELEIVLRDGSKVIIENFDELAQSGGRDTILQLSDNTVIHPEELAARLAQGPVRFASSEHSASVVPVNAPEAGQTAEKLIESGHEYRFNFSLADTTRISQSGTNLILTFKDGGVLVLKDFYIAMESELPPAMTLADGTVIDSSVLLTSIDGKKAAEDVQNIEPAAGDEAAQAASVEPAAGDAGARPTSTGRGYGFGSSIDPASLEGENPIGPIAPTSLQYGAPFVQGDLNPGEERFNDTVPTIAGDSVSIDETDLGPNVITGDAGANFGANGPGSVALNSTFTAGGSLAGGALTSNGIPVTVTLAGNTYTGTAGGVTVFTLVVDPSTGAYTFTQIHQLDHADNADPNDLITLQFGVTATDSDGDTGTGTITIGVLDDAPVAVDDAASVGSSPLSVSGSVTLNDDPGADQSAEVTQVVFNGTTYAVPAAGAVSIAATYGTLVIEHTGAYTYTSSNTAEGTDSFVYTLVDFDGDSSSATLSIEVTDIDTVPTASSSGAQVDETDLSPNVVAGSVVADFKDDGPGTFSFDTFTSSGSKLGGALTSNGVPVDVTLTGTVYTGTAGGSPVFTIVLDPATGAYTFIQNAPLDHADGVNPDDAITLQFGINATDADGDTTPATITIDVLDDAPVAVNDVNSVAAGTTSVSGNVLANDDGGNDVSASVTQVVFGGAVHAVPAGGTISVTGTYGTLVIGADGAYTYTSLNTAEGADVFTYSMQDFDGDPASATLTLTVQDIDTAPAISAVTGQVDETGLTASVSGSLSADFKDDAPGGFGFTGGFSSGGSQLGGALTSNGVPVDVTLAGTTYTGAAGGVTVFTLTLDAATGAYTFNQFKPLDHADGANPNDVIALEFGVNVVDSDGDATPSTITINVLDDAPVAANDSGDVAAGTLSVSGNVVTNDVIGQDKPGYTVTQVTIGGTTVSVPASGTVTIDGTYGKLAIDNSGAYTYTSFNTAEGADRFTYQIQDRDGDTATANLTLNVTDIDTIPDVGAAAGTVDETDLGPNVATGSVPVNFRDDAPGSVALNNTFSFGGAVAGGSLKSCGDAVTVSLVGGSYVGIDADGVTVFTLTLDSATGAYTFTQFKALDHANPDNPDESLTLQFGVTATDSDGDTSAGSITITVKDDGVTANDDHNLFDTNAGATSGNVITGLSGGSGAADDLSNDGHNHVTKVTYKGIDYDVPETGEVVINGDFGTLKIQSDGSYTYALYGSGSGGSGVTGSPANFSETLEFPVVGEGSPKFSEASPNEGIDPSAFDITTSATGQIRIISETATIRNTLGLYTIGSDGTIQAVQVVVANVNTLALGGTANFDIPASSSGVGFFLIENGYSVNGGYAGHDLSTGNLAFYYHYGQPDQRLAKVTDAASDVSLVALDGSAPQVLSGSIYHTTDRDGSNLINPDGKVHTISGLADDADSTVLRIGFEDRLYQGDRDFSDVVFDFTYTPTAPKDSSDEFVYTLADCDGDIDTAVLTFDGRDLIDDKPVVSISSASVDETVIVGSGGQTVTGTISAAFGADGPGTIAATGPGSFTATGAAGGALTSNGVAVIVTLVGNQYIGKAGAATIFTLTLNDARTYTYTQTGPLDHANGSNPDDVITLKFGVTASDVDGDATDSQIVINVRDDGPVAANDVNTVDNAPAAVTGNVLANDQSGADASAVVTKVSIGTATVDVPATGSIEISGAHGKLTISADGSYSYQGTSLGNDAFTYQISDRDGDSATASLTVTVNDLDETPVVSNVIGFVDETDPGPAVVIGSVPVDFRGDGAGAFALTGFAAEGSIKGGVLASCGDKVTVSLVAGSYVGVDADGDTVFTLALDSATGAYTFTQFKALDHGDAGNPDDVLTLKFTVTAQDGDGDTGSGVIEIQIKDDAPVAHDDLNTFVLDGTSSAAGNVITGSNGGAGAEDTLSRDGGNHLTKVAFKGIEFDIPSSGATTVNGDFGTLTIQSNGAYTYELYKGVGSPTATDFHETLEFPVTGEGYPKFDENSPNEGVASTALDITTAATGTVTILSQSASHANSLGLYTIAADGTIQAAQIFSENVNTLALGGQTDFDIPANGAGVGFFLISNGYNANGGYAGMDLSAGNLVFYYHYGQADARIAKVTDTATDVKLVYVNGTTEEVLSGMVYHTTDRDGANALNPDGRVHTISGLADESDPTVLRIGFEDLYNQGDQDFADVVFDFTYKPAAPAPTSDEFAYTLVDCDGDASTAVLQIDGTAPPGFASTSMMSFDSDADIFALLAGASAVIEDFNPGEGDRLDLSALIQDFDPVTDAINDFVYARSEGADSVISVDPDGQGAQSQPYDVAVLKDVNVSHVEDIVQLVQQHQNQGGTGAV
jgi:T1SS-143 domain-containing protein